MADFNIPEVPLNPSLEDLRRIVSLMRSAVLELGQQTVAPLAPNIIVCTPVAFGNTIDFTRTDGAGYYLYFSKTPDIKDAIQINLQDGNHYEHFVGKDGLTYYYWLQAYNVRGQLSPISNPVSGTTLASGTAVTPPTPPPPTTTSSPDSGGGTRTPIYSPKGANTN